MSTATKKKSMKGVRYTDAQKKEVTDFAHKYNQDNGRGGQSKAAEKFNISPLTVATWMKAADNAPASSKAAAKASASTEVSDSSEPAKAVAMPSKVAGKSRAGSRYTPEQKAQVTDFVADYNTEHGRGGATQAIKKFGVAALTISAWMKAAGMNGKVNKTSKASKPTKATKGAKKAAPAASTRAASTSTSDAGDGMSAKLKELMDLSKQIASSEAELSKLQSRFASLKKSL